MKRRQQEKALIRKRAKVADRKYHRNAIPRGKWKKQRPETLGRCNCWWCMSKKKTARLPEIAFREQLAECR